jgi:thymidylate kinase
MPNDKLIIFIGPDMVGKTNIGQALAKDLGIQYFKNTAEHDRFKERDFLNELKYCAPLTLLIYSQVEMTGGGLIIDRFTPCEYAYAKAYTRETDESLLWNIDKELKKLNAVLIYCYKTKYINFEDEVAEEKDMKAVMAGYENYLSKTVVSYVKLDTTDENLEQQIGTIKFHLPASILT